MTVRNAELEDMKQLGHIMAVSFRTAFADFVTKKTLDACAQEDNCAAMLEGLRHPECAGAGLVRRGVSVHSE